ncbi:hypothetical protein ACIQUM_07460 [Amycolatopsis azurea]|uniref:hypothetical protein n=1 Tax=Amycolatopsis azurea TaxID=36819 RepID=UPI0038307A93
MTILDHIPDVVNSGPVPVELPGPAELDAIVGCLPELDWCKNCIPGNTLDLGMPRVVLGRGYEGHGPVGVEESGPPRLVIWLECGHTIR